MHWKFLLLQSKLQTKHLKTLSISAVYLQLYSSVNISDQHADGRVPNVNHLEEAEVW